MQKILIPTDFSINSLNAIQYVVELYRSSPVKFYILHAFADEVYEVSMESPEEGFADIRDIVYQQSQRTLADFNNKINKVNPEHIFEIISNFGQLVDSVNELVDSENIDLVVMGTKGKTADSHLTFGSNTLQVIKYVKCPVLAVPSVNVDAQPKNILFPTDYMLPYKSRELELLGGITRQFSAKIHFLHVSKFPNISLRQKDNKGFLEDFFGDNETVCQMNAHSNVTEAINTFVIENPIDMLVMVNTRHSYLENILYQSTIEKIGLNIDIPFLVLQNLPRR